MHFPRLRMNRDFIRPCHYFWAEDFVLVGTPSVIHFSPWNFYCVTGWDKMGSPIFSPKFAMYVCIRDCRSTFCGSASGGGVYGQSYKDPQGALDLGCALYLGGFILGGGGGLYCKQNF